MNRMKWFRTAPRTRLASALSPHAQLRLQYSSISPSPSFVKPDQFNKTGLRGESDSTKINSRSNEYSQSGGDDIVAEQTIASFRDSKDTSPATAKETAGRGNVINPLDYSPASPELSKHIEDQTVVEKNVERDPNTKSHKGVTRKARKITKVEIDHEKLKMTRR